MLIVMTDDQVKAGDERRSFLYQSAYTVDNLTAVLMDTSHGNTGLYEACAPAKAHAIIGWLKTITGAQIPDRRTEGI